MIIETVYPPRFSTWISCEMNCFRLVHLTLLPQGDQRPTFFFFHEYNFNSRGFHLPDVCLSIQLKHYFIFQLYTSHRKTSQLNFQKQYDKSKCTKPQTKHCYAHTSQNVNAKSKRCTSIFSFYFIANCSLFGLNFRWCCCCRCFFWCVSYIFYIMFCV